MGKIRLPAPKAQYPPPAPCELRDVEPTHRNRPLTKDGENEQVALTEARLRALDLRRQGKSYRQIAFIMGIGHNTAYNYVQAELIDLRNQTKEIAEEILDIEMLRLDNMLTRLEAGINAGDPASIVTALKIQDQRAKLLGLYAPTKREVKSTIITEEEAAALSTEELTDLVKELYGQVAPKAITGTVVNRG